MQVVQQSFIKNMLYIISNCDNLLRIVGRFIEYYVSSEDPLGTNTMIKQVIDKSQYQIVTCISDSEAAAETPMEWGRESRDAVAKQQTLLFFATWTYTGTSF